MSQQQSLIVDIARLRRCPIQLRKVKKESLQYVTLLDSIRKVGVLTPIMVRPVPNEPGEFEVVLGTHRYECSLDARLESIPAVCRDVSDEDVELYQFVENAQVVPTEKIDYVRRIQRMIARGETTINEFAHQVCKHPDTIKNWLSLNFLSQKAKVLLDSGQISGILSIELAKLPVAQQDQLLPLHSQLPAGEFLEELRQAVRQFRLGKREARGYRKTGIQPSCRQWRQINEELTRPVEKAIVLTRRGATTASDGWDACIEWVCSMDEETLGIRQARMQKRLNNDT